MTCNVSINELLSQLKTIEEESTVETTQPNISSSILSLKTVHLKTDDLDDSSKEALQEVFLYIRQLKIEKLSLTSQVETLNTEIKNLKESGMTTTDYVTRLLSLSDDVTSLKNEYGNFISKGSSNGTNSSTLAMSNKITALELQIELLKEIIASKPTSETDQSSSIKNLGDLLLALTK